ncbi:Ethanolamine kinase 1 [Escovopsis weberi]|uniref:ethanolamine kinase n=1 Tax=Escovopsis weberi TaxID=150374 RepID=A0A0M8MY58_ESCWE|nr:Ethanolamine kinase 1 [Escovopsis weberi]
MSPAATIGSHSQVRFLPFSYDCHNSQASALKLLHTLLPQWASDDSNIELIRFTDGITNTLLKAVNRRPGLSKADVDREAVLLRAYGNGTAVIIDREREAANHELLMRYGLAPELLARFGNGMLYRFVRGAVAQPKDLRDPQVLLAIARRLAQWHATVPCLPDAQAPSGADAGTCCQSMMMMMKAAAGKPIPNLWMSLQKFILALPTATDAQRERQAQLQQELDEMVQKLSQRPGLGRNGLVFAHCDLLSGNVIIHRDAGKELSVSFIDYEYATPSPAAFDIANHFAEWTGFDCDYKAIPTSAQRRCFIEEYIKSYAKLSGRAMDIEEETRKLMHEVDMFRGVPGFYWGVWALIQAEISHIEFDYPSYAELRLAEWFDYKAEQDGSRKASGKEKPLREQTWSRAE